MESFFKPLILVLLLLTSFTTLSQQAEPDTLIGCILKIEVGAAFPGGNEIWNKYLIKKLNPDIAMQNGAPVGIYNVKVLFLITKEGSIDSVKALTNYGCGMEEEAVRVIPQAPKWSPAIKNARTVPQWKQHIITFTVSNK